MDDLPVSLLEKIVKDSDPCYMISSAFVKLISDVKGCHVNWEDLVRQAGKLHACLRSTLSAITQFLDSLQKIADAASAAKGATRDIGTALTRVCLRHRSVEARLKTFTSTLSECVVVPVSDKLDEWKKKTNCLDQKHSKDYRRQRAELKKRSMDAMRVYKKCRKNKHCDQLHAINGQIADIRLKYQKVEQNECGLLEAAMIEERSHYCHLVACLKPLVQCEMGVSEELGHLSEVMSQLETHTHDPFTIPPASQQVLVDIRGESGVGVSCGLDSCCSDSALGSRRTSLSSVTSGSTTRTAATTTIGHDDALPVARESVTSHDSGCNLPDSSSVSCSVVTDDVTDRPASPRHPSSCTGAAAAVVSSHRANTVSAALERGGVTLRPALGSLTFVAPSNKPCLNSNVNGVAVSSTAAASGNSRSRCSVASHYAIPPRVCLPDFNRTGVDMVVPQPIYANMDARPGVGCEAQSRDGGVVSSGQARCQSANTLVITPTCHYNMSTAFCRRESDGSAGSSSGYGDSVCTNLVGSNVEVHALPPPPDFLLDNLADVAGSLNTACFQRTSFAFGGASMVANSSSLRRRASHTGGRSRVPPPPPARATMAAPPPPPPAPASPVLMRRDPHFLNSLCEQLTRRAGSSPGDRTTGAGEASRRCSQPSRP